MCLTKLKSTRFPRSPPASLTALLASSFISFCVIFAPAASALINMLLAFHSTFLNVFLISTIRASSYVELVPIFYLLRALVTKPLKCGWLAPAVFSINCLIFCIQFWKMRRFLETTLSWYRRNACTIKENCTVLEDSDLIRE